MEIVKDLKSATLTSNPLFDETNLIVRFLADVEVRGLVGEKSNATTAFLCAVSARLNRPLNLTVCGESSTGKNYLLDSVASLIPDEQKKIISGMSPKVLMHAAEDEFQNKAVFIAEYEGIAKADYSVRTFQSEQRIEWDYVETGSKGIKKKKNIVKGPAAFLQATTRPVLHPENETRLLFISLDGSKDQTGAIMRQQAERAVSGHFDSTRNEKIVEEWQTFIRSLKQMNISIPYAHKLCSSFPSDRVRSRRDFPKLLGFIESLAHLHQNHREKNGDCILAAPEDYLEAKKLFESSYTSGPDRVLSELLAAAESLGECEFRVSDLMEKTGWGKSKLYTVLQRAEDLGCIGEVERGVYRFIRRSVVAPLELPDTI
jgi:hypothetical protein